MPRWEGSCEKPHRRRCLLSEFFKKNQCSLKTQIPTSSSVCHSEPPCSTGTQGLKAVWS